ncbi:hypothetical protein BB559_002278 [Furculomyces boomerangus]|uniref:Uncharacterized protein n=2 Tax=Harpellales TaxID=61421 RepID=A0A2T9YWJ4_9FUNG|nr:hypothetical protein BB559_002278 [Furculomyces boomerangus]PVZ97078.1 hypothetical protein BB558_006991 [Smittium angustum]PWA02605.1 hypothetical protein BB558_001265 [Smittium angustum]
MTLNESTGLLNTSSGPNGNEVVEINTPPLAPHDSHEETHMLNTEVLRDAIIGLADGLTVPFALAAGLSSLADTKLVVLAGFAELIAGSISMGLGGYLATKSEMEHFEAEREREFYEVMHYPEAEEQEIVEIFEPYGITHKEMKPILDKLKLNPALYVDFMMKFELSLEKPNQYRSITSAATIGSAYFVGGVIPLLPYVFSESTTTGLIYSSMLTLIALFFFGIARARVIGLRGVYKSAFHTMMIGTVAAAASYLMVKLTG